MSTRPRIALAAALAACLIAVPAYTQEIKSPAPAPAPANLAFVDGSVDVIQSGVAETAEPPLMLLEGDVVRTRNGRAEIIFGDGTLLHVSHDSELEILGEERMRLISGRVIVRLSHAAARPYVVDTPASSVRLAAQGEYALTTDPSGRLEVAVARGTATLADAQPWTLSGGQMLTVLGAGGRPIISSFNSARFDAFASWSHTRATGFASSVSAPQLPYELRPYGPVLDRYGRWDYVAPHGYVWFPSVGASWRPYSDGSWTFTRYGWTWRGGDRWAWPTHHYGRWGFNGTFWYWVPATAWAPAWVTWSVGAGYVSWAPYGWHTHGGFDYRDRRDHAAYAPHYSPWRGWTVLPRQHFGPRRNVRTYAVEGDRLEEATRRVLLGNAVPSKALDDVAVPRHSVEAPGARGNVRRPAAAAPRDGDLRRAVPAASAAPRAADRRDPGDAPAYTPRSTGTGSTDRVGGGRTDEGRAVPKDTPRATGSERQRDSGDGGRRGAVRAPEAAAPRSAPKGDAPRARPQSGDAGAAAGAVKGSGGARPKG